MASTIKLKNGSGAPTTGDLVQGEPALDLTNKRLYTENASGVVIEVGTSPSTIDINAGTIDGTVIGGSTPAAVTTTALVATTADINGGTIDGTVIGGSSAAAITGTTITGTSFVSSGDMTFGDSDKAIFGAGSDLQIYHDGSESYIDDAGTGSLLLRGSNSVQMRKQGTTELMLRAVVDADVELYYDGSEKLATTSTGIDVTGTVTADGLTVIGSVAAGAVLATISNSGANGAAQLYLNNDAQNWIVNTRVDDAFSVFNSTSGKTPFLINTNGDISFYEDTGTTAKLFWDASAESLGIGTSSPANPLTVSGSAGTIASFSNGVDADLLLKAQSGVTTLTPSTGILAFGTSSTERMRIDSSGNLLVGKSGTAFGTAGIEASASNGLWSTRSGLPALALNRLSTDGSIADFYKNGTAVGSIGVDSGDNLYIGGSAASHSGLYFGTNTAAPITAGTLTDAVTDLGTAGYRFKDLYLSGGVYLGGTGAANLLDDYEEGTWTPVLSDGTNNATASTAVGTYTKIGRMVHVKGTLIISSLGSVAGSLLFITGLPFTTSGTANTSASANFGLGQGLNLPVGTSLAGYLNTGNTRIVVQSWDAVAGTTNTTPAEWSADGGAYFDATYYI